MVDKAARVAWLKDIDKDDSYLVGGKNANLGEMIQAKFPVPGGFAVTSNAYNTFIKENNLETKIKHLLGTVHFDNTDSLMQVSRLIKKIIIESPMPDSLAREIRDYYIRLGGVFKEPLVAIRSSATSEDSKDASFAGQQETYLNVKGDASLLLRIKDAWASLFEPRAMYYRHEQKMNPAKASIALVVQKMIESETSGVMFSIDPITNNKDRIVIEAIYGLGEYIVQGRVSPDHYEVDKSTYTILDKKRSHQDVMLVKAQTENKEVKVSWTKNKRQKISDKHIQILARLARRLEEHYFFPQDIEWAIEKDVVYIVQTRPITTFEKSGVKEEQFVARVSSAHHPILVGDPASPGIKSGPVKILLHPKEIGKVQPGDVLVAPYTNPDYVPAMKKSAAIITEQGGRTSHAAIVSREFGIPAVVGTPQATKKLKDGMVVSVNGGTGQIYKGNVLTMVRDTAVHHESVKTHTKVYVNVAEPEVATEVALKNVDGVGLLRAEFMIAEIGTHPRKLIHDGKSKEFIDKLSTGMATICRAFYPRPVYYRATDFKTNEYRNLKGGKDFEPVEPNPMLGYRGVYRYINDAKVFNLELESIKRVRNKEGLNNLNLMLPFVRTVAELEIAKKLIHKSGLVRSKTFQLFMMAEIPSNVILIDQFIQAGIDGVSIGSNDLTMLILGTDRDNEEVASEYDERNEAVLWALERLITSCKKYHIPVSICGQAPSNYPDLVEKLVEWGVYSVSVSPDAIEHTRDVIKKAENKLHDRHPRLYRLLK